MAKQRDIFLRSEGDAWFSRNEQAVREQKLPDEDPILQEILGFVPAGKLGLKILEIGCGDGSRLAWLKDNLNAECFGIDPSEQAILAASSKGISAQQGTAELLPFDNDSFDIVIFGFCLYLCDREDLFHIAYEADRVLRTPGWLAILDFYSASPRAREYHHTSGVLSYKMDYRSLFDWHSGYECMTHKVRDHIGLGYTASSEDWIATSILLKRQSDMPT